MKEGGLDDKNAPVGDAWKKKVKGFCSKFVNASSEPDHVQAYAGQLSAAMNKLQVRLLFSSSSVYLSRAVSTRPVPRL
jgi:hypothetical protein